jgi:hypothetical protein
MIVTNKDEWDQKHCKDEDVALDHPLVNSFKYFYIGDDVAILVNGKPYTRITRPLHDDPMSDVKHINKDKDVLYKIQKVTVLKESDPSYIDIGYKIIYFRNVEI